jgi:hypothetical protein
VTRGGVVLPRYSFEVRDFAFPTDWKRQRAHPLLNSEMMNGVVEIQNSMLVASGGSAMSANQESSFRSHWCHGVWPRQKKRGGARLLFGHGHGTCGMGIDGQAVDCIYSGGTLGPAAASTHQLQVAALNANVKTALAVLGGEALSAADPAHVLALDESVRAVRRANSSSTTAAQRTLDAAAAAAVGGGAQVFAGFAAPALVSLNRPSCKLCSNPAVPSNYGFCQEHRAPMGMFCQVGGAGGGGGVAGPCVGHTIFTVWLVDGNERWYKASCVGIVVDVGGAGGGAAPSAPPLQPPQPKRLHRLRYENGDSENVDFDDEVGTVLLLLFCSARMIERARERPRQRAVHTRARMAVETPAISHDPPTTCVLPAHACTPPPPAPLPPLTGQTERIVWRSEAEHSKAPAVAVLDGCGGGELQQGCDMSQEGVCRPVCNYRFCATINHRPRRLCRRTRHHVSPP